MAIKTKSKRKLFIEETLSPEAVAEILDVKGVERMFKWLDSELEKFGTNGQFNSYEEFLEAFRTEFKDRKSHTLALATVISGVDPLRWQNLIEEILDDYLDRIVIERRRSERKKHAEDIHNFISMFVFFAALPAHLGLAYEQSAYKSRKRRTEMLASRNEQIRKYSEWRINAMTPLSSKAKLYDDIRGHFGLSIGDRQLRKILKRQ